MFLTSEVAITTQQSHVEKKINLGYTVDSRYLDLGYLEQPLISKRKSGPCLNLTSGNKILWIRGEIAPQEQFLPFPTIFEYIFLTKGV